MTHGSIEEIDEGRLKVLIIEDQQSDIVLIKRQLDGTDFPVAIEMVSDNDEFIEKISSECRWDVIISDFNVPGMDFGETLKTLKTRCPKVPVILVSGAISTDTAVQLVKAGVTDFVLKDRLESLNLAIEKALSEVANQRERELIDLAYRDLFENVDDAVFVYDAEGWLLDTNPAAELMFGFPSVEILFRSVEKCPLFEWGNIEELKSKTQEAFLMGVSDFTLTAVHANGRKIDAPAKIVHSSRNGDGSYILIVRSPR